MTTAGAPAPAGRDQRKKQRRRTGWTADRLDGGPAGRRTAAAKLPGLDNRRDLDTISSGGRRAKLDSGGGGSSGPTGHDQRKP